MIQYDPKIIQDFADRLYRKANSIIIFYSIIGVIVGLIGGHLISSEGYLTALIGAGIFGVIGYQLGTEKAFQLKLQAQQALCQIKIEENSRE